MFPVSRMFPKMFPKMFPEMFPDSRVIAKMVTKMLPKMCLTCIMFPISSNSQFSNWYQPEALTDENGNQIYFWLDLLKINFKNHGNPIVFELKTRASNFPFWPSVMIYDISNYIDYLNLSRLRSSKNMKLNFRKLKKIFWSW